MDPAFIIIGIISIFLPYPVAYWFTKSLTDKHELKVQRKKIKRNNKVHNNLIQKRLKIEEKIVKKANKSKLLLNSLNLKEEIIFDRVLRWIA